MHRRVLTLTASAFILAYGAVGAIAQERMTAQPDQQQTQPGSTAEEEEETTTGQGGMMRQGTAGTGATGGETTQGSMMERGMMGMGAWQGRSPVMLRVIFALVDSNGDGTVSLQEFQAAHERIFRAMDTNKDGQLTQDEILAFIHGTRRSAPQQ